MTELPSEARISLTRWMAEDRLADSRKVVDDLRAVWPTHASVLEANIPRVVGAEGMTLSTRDSVYADLICFRMIDSITYVGANPAGTEVEHSRATRTSQAADPSVAPAPTSSVPRSASSHPVFSMAPSSSAPTDRPTSDNDPNNNRSHEQSVVPSDDDEAFLDEIEF